MEKRGLFEKLFSKFKSAKNYVQYRFLNGQQSNFYPFGNDAYSSDTVRSAVHTIASNAAKLKAKHIRRVENGIVNTNSNIERLLTIRPNPIINAYDFIYKIVTQLMLKNNAFVYIEKDDYGVITGFYPINFNRIELLEAPENEIYVRFSFGNGKVVTLPYTEVIHLRRHFNENEMYGESNNKALLPTLELIKTTNDGISSAIKSSANLRGLLKFTQSMLKPEDLKKQRDDFIKDYMDVNNNGGVAALDAKADYIELKGESKLINAPQMKVIEEKVYKYYNINENIIMSRYNENEWNAFYESVLEPISLQFSLEFTSKCFTDREIGFRNEIIFEANRLAYASNTTKISLARDLMPMGVFTINEIRDVFNLAPVQNGDKRMQTLNVVNADKADNYQGVDNNNDDGKEGSGKDVGESDTKQGTQEE